MTAFTTTPPTGVRAVLADGRVAVVRRLGPPDRAELTRLHAELPERDQFLRFFTIRPVGLDAMLARLVEPADAQRLALGAFLDERLVGVAHFDVLADPTEAEVALVVDHRQQAHGVGTLLLEHLASAARERGIRRFVAEVLAENARMVRVFTDAGFPMTTRREEGCLHVVLSLDPVEAYLEAVGERESHAGVASLSALLRPRSVAVVGASRRRDAIGNAVLRGILSGGFTGACYAVNPHASEVEGIPAVPSVRDLPSTVDLAVLCVPAEAVPEVAEECGRHGVRALVVISAGITQRQDLADGLLAAVRRHGMRLVGPNCLGVVNTEASVRLAATFSGGEVPAGRVGVVTQSGGMGIALLDQLSAVGLGVSTLVSTGDKYDVSGNDLLMWWRRDADTDVAVLYLESFGNPRKFARLARRLAARKPVVAVRTGTSEVARRAAASHTAATATPAATRDALYEQAGVIAVEDLSELLAVTCALSWQPLPKGSRVAVVSNAGGAGVLAADACARHGLDLPELDPRTRDALRRLVPDHASVANPVDTTAGVTDEVFVRCLRAVLDDPGVDAVLVLAAPTAVTNPVDDVASAVADSDKPVFAVHVGQLDVVRPLRPSGPGRVVPAFADPAVAARSLAAVARYSAWRERPTGAVPDLPDIDLDAARDLVADHLATHQDGGWLDPVSTLRLLGHFGLPVTPGTVVADADEAVAAARGFLGPVAVKAVATGLLHKSRGGGVVLGVRGDAEVRAAVTRLRYRFGEDLTGVLVQPMVEPGRELLVGVHNDGVFGPLVVLGLGGVDTDLVADRTCRLVPLTDRDAAEMLGQLRCAPALLAEQMARRFDAPAVLDVLLRVGRLADLLPEVAELDLNPLVVHGTGAVVVDARVRLEPRPSVDPFLRRLRA
ncbi:Acyl-CoA synthetase (NDP forming) [Streptoalloteichus tenebrarius]|uniref:Acyl-CoA synthetase (NDP forming) n=1 Tax=Streptoalloteichus tenebrarius (strain ATCC 17920 / DSM 40477 / JCM 4838 / CBS 697.72 / NBRC 16177 / NCIMB 11028 / NRRL B-12390 / A12253. 1 / ISP 5477) TaxID=1933 RepID=A0ABT1I0F0_STRSD|nr:bifunctional GNAT family N-acetyltransferase/acetate--CoA ligase family protein [Streptoalloteichus tenebrarius]MCP2261234.1 Acyl-CoA synthetase (NDP forming) [Streptoalloteichus tenebrarius]BFF04426.1 bifunctional GNAT family N-acetyltransferase/acetate--CoA ligase family protein [Streptoalloteichus tenebrarius]